MNEEDLRNQDSISDSEILVVSFGTSYPVTRKETIGAIEQAVEDAFPEWSVRRAFTSKMILKKLKDRDGIGIDSVNEALERALDNNVKRLLIQPTLLMDGVEYHELIKIADEYRDRFDHYAIGSPLLTSDEDLDSVIKAVSDELQAYDDGKTAFCLMGHGTSAESNRVYGMMQERISKSGSGSSFYIGTVEASPSLDDVLSDIKKEDFKRVVLFPLMVVAGDHASNDMAGERDGSWKTAFEKEGFETICVIRGLGQISAIRDIYVEHARKALSLL